MSRMKCLSAVLFVLPLLLVSLVFPIQAQDMQQSPSLILYTAYPSQVVDINEVLSIDLTLHTDGVAQLVNLSMRDLPDGWASSFRGGGHAVDSVYVIPGTDSTVQLRVDPSIDVAAGTYEFKVLAQGDHMNAELPISLTFEERLPASLDASVDLPTVRGKPDTTFRYNLTLHNTGDDPVMVDLSATVPQYLMVTFKSSSQEVTSVPIEANQTKRISVEVSSLLRGLPAGTYPITITATSGDLTTTTQLTAEVVGQPDISVTTPDGRLSGSAELGGTTPITLVLANQGSAPARGIELSATKPSGWKVDFVPATVDEIQPGQQVEVTANIQPADKAIAGDYVLTFRATPQDSTQQSAEYRVTVQTSTLWGIIGVALIAAAVVIIGMSVMHFGRR